MTSDCAAPPRSSTRRPQVLLVALDRVKGDQVASSLQAAGIETTRAASLKQVLACDHASEFDAVVVAAEVTRRPLWLLHERFPCARLVTCVSADALGSVALCPLSGTLCVPLDPSAVAFRMGAVLAAPPKVLPQPRILLAHTKAYAFSRSLGLEGVRSAIVSWLVQALGNKEIAWRLERQEGAIEHQARAVYRGSGTRDRKELSLAVLAFEHDRDRLPPPSVPSASST